MRVTSASILVRHEEPRTATVDGFAVVFSIRAGAYFGLNGVGSEIWAMLGEPRQVGHICADLAAAYDADPQVVARDVIAFLDKLVRSDLLRVIRAGAGA